MDNNSEAERDQKHICLNDLINQLGTQVEKLECLIRKIEGSNEPPSPSSVEPAASTPSLAAFLTESVGRIENFTIRLGNARDQLQELLF